MHAHASFDAMHTIVRCDAHERAMRRAGSCKATHEERIRAPTSCTRSAMNVARDRGVSVTTSVTGWCV